jgi:hypothetical protein
MLRKTSSSLTRDFAARRGSLISFRAIAGAMIPRRLFPPFGPDHDSSSLGVSVNRPLYLPDDLFGTLLRNAQNPRCIVHGHWPAVVDSDRLPHMLLYAAPVAHLLRVPLRILTAKGTTQPRLKPQEMDASRDCSPQAALSEAEGSCILCDTWDSTDPSL